MSFQYNNIQKKEYNITIIITTTTTKIKENRKKNNSFSFKCLLSFEIYIYIYEEKQLKTLEIALYEYINTAHYGAHISQHILIFTCYNI